MKPSPKYFCSAIPKSLQRCVTSLSVSSNVPSSSRKSTRSRADILPSLCWRSRRCAPPPSWASRSRRLSSAIFSSSFIGGHYRRALRPSDDGVGVGTDAFVRPAERSEAPNQNRRPNLRSQVRGVEEIQKFNFLFCRKKRRLERVARQF